MKISLLLVLVFTQFSAFAGSGALNGGDAVVCKDSVELLDVFEARQMQLTPDFGENADLRSMIAHVVSRLKKKDLFSANLLEEYSLEMVSDFELFATNPRARGEHVNLSNVDIAEINDSVHVSIPMGCKLIQLVAQRLIVRSFQFRYTINKTLWNRMDKVNQAMTILHEAWYRIMLDHDAENSISARFMNALTSSSYIEKISFIQYFKDLQQSEIKYYKVVNSSSSILSGHLKINMAKYELNYDYENDQVCVPRFVFTTNFFKTKFTKKSKRLKTTFKNVCFTNSRIKRLKLSSKYSQSSFLIEMDKFTLDMDGADIPNPIIHFHNNGKLKSFEGIKIDKLIMNSGKKYRRTENLLFDDQENPIGLN
jgi:hypothetical protein